MTDHIENRARAALEGVTPGPWEAGPSPVGYYDELSIHTADGLGVALVDEGECQDANARFIAAARSLVPEMADEIERLRAACAGRKPLSWAELPPDGRPMHTDLFLCRAVALPDNQLRQAIAEWLHGDWAGACSLLPPPARAAACVQSADAVDGKGAKDD